MIMMKKILKFCSISAICFLVLILNCLTLGFTNFGHSDVAEFISSNISLCEKEAKTNRTVFEMIPDNRIQPFFKNNKQAVALLANFKDSSVFLTWDTSDELFTTDYASSPSLVFGMSGKGKSKSIPFGLKLVAGNFESSYFDTYYLYENDDINYIYISEALCADLFPNIEYSNVVGKELSNINLKRSMIVAGICKNDTILTNDVNDVKFIVGNHLNFSTYFDYEKMVLKLDDNIDTNYSIFKSLFYSNGFIPPFSDRAYIKLSFNNNEWLEKEARIVYSNTYNMPNYLPFIFALFYLPIGSIFPFIIGKEIYKKYNSIPFFCISLCIIFLSFSLAELINSHKVWFGIHIIGAPVYSIVFEVLAILLLYIGFFLGNMFKNILKRNNKSNNSYEIKI